MTVSVSIIDHVKNSDLYSANEDAIQTWAETTLSHLKKHKNHHYELSVILVNNELSAQLNYQFRGKKNATNILSFNYDTNNESGKAHLGELVVCLQLVEKEANELNITPKEHWAHLIIHGILHLLGYDHVNEQETETMESLEIAILSKLGYDNPYR